MNQQGCGPVKAEGWRWTGHLAALVAAANLARAAVSVFLIAEGATTALWVPVLELAVGLAFVALAVHAYRRWEPLMAEQVRTEWELEKEKKEGEKVRP